MIYPDTLRSVFLRLLYSAAHGQNSHRPKGDIAFERFASKQPLGVTGQTDAYKLPSAQAERLNDKLGAFPVVSAVLQRPLQGSAGLPLDDRLEVDSRTVEPGRKVRKPPNSAVASAGVAIVGFAICRHSLLRPKWQDW